MKRLVSERDDQQFLIREMEKKNEQIIKLTKKLHEVSKFFFV